MDNDNSYSKNKKNKTNFTNNHENLAKTQTD